MVEPDQGRTPELPDDLLPPERVADPVTPGDLAHDDLTGSDPMGADSTGTDSTGADPADADPAGTDSVGADPTGTDPTGTDPTGTGSRVEAGPEPAPATAALVRVDPVAERVEVDGGGGRGLYWLIKNVILGPGIKRVFRPVVEGVDNVPEHGPAIIASNHLSVADWLFTPLALRRRITYVAKSDYFTGSGIKGFLQRRFFAGTGQVPIDRSGGEASTGALRAGLRVLRRGELFGIFPEGTRSHDGRLYKGRTGVARLALQAEVPVIPTAVVNTDLIAPVNKHFGRVVTPIVKFGKPLDFSRYYGMDDDRFVLRSITDEVMYAVMELSGQQYVDMYATAAREQLKQDKAGHEKPAPDQAGPDQGAGGAPRGRTAREGGAGR